VPLYQGWASLELREGNLTLAKRLISEALTRDKRHAPGWLIAAQIEERQGNDGLVGLFLRRGIECVPNSAELYRALGEYLNGKGKINDAREVLEKGLEVNPLHAPLYHSLAELEARVFNLKGLAVLNEKAAKLFNRDALASSSSSSTALGRRIQMGRSRGISREVSALSEVVGDSVDNDSEDTGGLDDVLGQFEDAAINEITHYETYAGRNETGKVLDS
jgi:tetratricopeptide (TPR) repeat protein